MSTTHSSRVIRYHPTEAQRAEFEQSGGRLLCRHCVDPPEPGGQLRGIPHTGPYQPRVGQEAQFCSTACMLAFTLERPSYRSQMQRAAIVKLHFELTGEYDVQPAPPQAMRDVFGGPWDIETFRRQSGAKRLVRVCEAPFVTEMTMAVAEIYQTDVHPETPAPAAASPPPRPPVEPDGCASEDGDGPAPVLSQLNEWGLTNLRRPPVQPPDLMEASEAPATSVYREYLEQVGQADWADPPAAGEASDAGEARAAAPKPKRARPAGPASGAGGGLTRFLRK